MHLLPQDARSLDAEEAAVDLGQEPGDIVFLSFTDSDLALAAASGLRGLRVAPLARLRHPMSVDLYLDRVCREARAILVRLLGGLDYWRYGAEEIAALAREQGIALAILAGDGREDHRLAALSTVKKTDLERLERYWREGGAQNAASALRELARLAGLDRGEPDGVVTLPKHGFHVFPGAAAPQAARAVIIFYRSILLADDTAPIAALAAALAARGLAAAAIFVGSLKDEETASFVEEALAQIRPAVILNATAFSAQRETGGTALDRAGCPVLQLVTAGTTEEAWSASTRGLSASDLAMHVALPELDGRLLAGTISFKTEIAHGGFTRMIHRPHAERVAAVADKARAWARLAATPRQERRIALVLSNYPGADGRLAHAVGLDAPASTLAILDRLAGEGYDVRARPASSRRLMERLSSEQAVADATSTTPRLRLALATYRDWLARLPPLVQEKLLAAWSDPLADPSCDGTDFVIAALLCGKVALAVQPDRGSPLDRKADHHSQSLPPRHGYLAFYLWLREAFAAHAMIHLGTHGTLEWLPGKAVALSSGCFPDVAVGALPVLYPFIVNNPGEAAQAKRRLGAVTIGHMTPPLREAGLSGEALEVERLIDEYAAAAGLDRRRMAYLAREILDRARDCGLMRDCHVAPGVADEEALASLDAYLCDVKQMQIRDGLHVYGMPPHESELDALLSGLDGRFIPPGPAGAPSRGRADVLPTGRNLTTLDPRAVPTRAAMAIGARSAEEIVRRYRQDHGEYPRSVALDLWGSATMRTGGDDLAQALALLGVGPIWDHASNRVSGFDIVPLARLDRPRIDVMLRISGLFRDVFAGQIGLFDAAVRALAALDEEDEFNPLAAARRAGEERPLRIFGAAPAVYGAGIVDRITRGAWQSRADLGHDYLATGGFAYGAGLDGAPAREAFARRVAAANLHVHGQDHCEIDLLDDITFAAHQGGFAAALAALGAKAALYHADLSDPDRPRLRTLAEEVGRVVQGRAANPAWIAGMMRHGYPGAAEMANAVDALFAFSATSGVVDDACFDMVHAAYLEDETVCAFLDHANPAAATAIRRRLAEAVRRGLWKPRRNSVALLLEATP
jgi:cobaltochelatase CobN